MKYIQLSWDNFKNLVDERNLTVQYIINDANYYQLWVVDETAEYECLIKIDSPTSTNQQDFEDNYKALANKPAGKTTSRVSMYVRGVKADITGTTDTIDIDFATGVELQGIVAMVKGADWGDSVRLEVGYVDGQGIWQTAKIFGENVYLRDSAGWETYEYRNDAISKIPTSVKLRLFYSQANTATTKSVIIHYITHK